MTGARTRGDLRATGEMRGSGGAQPGFNILVYIIYLIGGVIDKDQMRPSVIGGLGRPSIRDSSR